MITWKVCSDLHDPVYQDALNLRKAVFIEEQKIPADIEIDELENACWHLVLYDQSEAIATCRLFPKNAETIKLQRVAVKKSKRGFGYGSKLLTIAEQVAKEKGYQKIILHAQEPSLSFYEKAHYQKQGDCFLEAGIPHYLMKKEL